jgi:putative heme-binding domain-containing protein
MLDNPNPWLVRKARRLLADRRDPEVILPLRTTVLETKNDRLALESLWALHVSGGFNDRFAEKVLAHRSTAVRKWTVRFLGDEREVSPNIAARLKVLAQTEPDVMVRSQLAATAKRLPASAALAIVEALVRRDADSRDPYIPLLLWWAVEQHAVSGLLQVEAFFTSAVAWQSALARETIDERLMRRWIAEGTTGTYDACAKLLASAPDAETQHRLLAALDQGFRDRPNSPITFGSGGLFANSAASEIKTASPSPQAFSISSALTAELAKLWRDDAADTALIRVAARTGNHSARQRAVALATGDRAVTALRIDVIRLLSELSRREDAVALLNLVGHGPESVQLAALDALSGFDVPELAEQLIARYTNLTQRVRARTCDVLLSRNPWARTVLREIDAARFSPREFAVQQLRVIALHRDKELDDLVRKHWGNISGGTPEEKLAEMRRLNNDLNAGSGDPIRGREVFTRLCASCHALFGESGKVGPDLTHANRTDREFLLASIVDPSAVVRKEYIAQEVEMADGRVLSGVIAEQSGGNFTLLSANGERSVVPQAQVKSLRESALSLMPEDLVKPLKPQELRDLFSYLQSTNIQSSTP